MYFLDFQKKMRDYPVFTKQDIRMLFFGENLHTVDKQLSLWAAQKKIVKIKNGLYVLAADYTKENVAAEVIAAKLYEPSYISLEYALSLFNMIPEAVFEITSVTTKPTRVFQTELGVFRYRKIKSDCFFGFSTMKQGNLPYSLASPEKALVDFLYLNSHRFTPELQTWKDLRLQNLQKIKFHLLLQYTKKFKNKKLFSLILHVKKYATSS